MSRFQNVAMPSFGVVEIMLATKQMKVIFEFLIVKAAVKGEE